MAEESGHFDALKVRVASGESVRDAAAAIGISERQAYRISGTAEFKASVNAVRTEIAERAVASLLSVVEVAIQTLRECCDADRESDRIAAAKAVLANMLPLTENVELRRRVDDLESRAAAAAGEAGD